MVIYVWHFGLLQDMGVFAVLLQGLCGGRAESLPQLLIPCHLVFALPEVQSYAGAPCVYVALTCFNFKCLFQVLFP